MRKSMFLMIGLVAAVLAGASSLSLGQSGDDAASMRKEIEALKERQKALEREVQDLKAIMRARMAPPAATGPQDTLAQPVSLNIESAPFLGKKDAKVTVVEFSDYQCPFCARYSQETLPALIKDYVDAGKVKYVMRDFPIPALHPQAAKAHEAAHCAGEQGKYWQMHHRLFDDIRDQDAAKLSTHAGALRLNVPKFEQCLASGRHTATVKKGIEDGQRAGVRGTPSFFFGVSGDGRTVQATRMLRGAQPYKRFKDIMDPLIADAPPR